MLAARLAVESPIDSSGIGCWTTESKRQAIRLNVDIIVDVVRESSQVRISPFLRAIALGLRVFSPPCTWCTLFS